MVEVLRWINSMVWGVPALLLILGTGIYLSLGSGFCQITMFFPACKSFFQKLKPQKFKTDGVSPFQALCTALAATVGTGNIAGVAGAISVGGPGAVFWMLLCAVLGMVIKCSEATLAVRYRKKSDTGEFVGGPMYMIEQGLGLNWKWLGALYSFFGVVAAFGVGNATQINAVIGGIHSAAAVFGWDVSFYWDLTIAAILAIVIFCMLLGGAKRIGMYAERLIPFASAAYLILGVGFLAARWQVLPVAIGQIVSGAFSPQAVTGGLVGSLLTSVRTGASRGTFTNEAGMGTASIAHAGAQVSHPAEQGLMGIMEVFLDTVVICFMTALVILCSGVCIPYGVETGTQLTVSAFETVYGGWVSIFIAVSLVLFAFSTVMGWGLYGVRCAQYLLGEGVCKWFCFLQAVTVLLGAVLKTDTVWLLAETINGLMAIPNLIALLWLSPEFFRLMKDYKTRTKLSFGGTNENFHQCKPVRAFSYAEVPPSCRES